MQPSGRYMYHQFNIQQFYVLSTHCIYVFCVDLRTNKLFSYTTLTDWFYNRDLTLYSPVVTICTASLTFNNSTFCPHSVSYVFCVDLGTNSDYFPIQHKPTGFHNREGVCLQRGTDWIFIYNSVLFPVF